mmetsp:Transcript_31161/g.63210  ORF Transcript_31161/g.63210 Transcript_31161/m.63210 type:complete len:295 (-) Transcript_31161:1154-2038(-)
MLFKARTCAFESLSSSSYRMDAWETNSYAIALNSHLSAACAHCRNSLRLRSGYPLLAMALTISCTNWNILREEYLRVGGSSCFSKVRTVWESLRAANTSGTSVCLMRVTPPCPNCFRASKNSPNCSSVSSFLIRCTSLDTSPCSRSNASLASSPPPPASSSLPSADAAPEPPAPALGSSRSRGVIMAKSFSRRGRSPKVSECLVLSTARTSSMATWRRLSQGRNAKMSEYSSSSRTWSASVESGMDSRLSTSITEASSRAEEGACAFVEGVGFSSAAPPPFALAFSTATACPRQ